MDSDLQQAVQNLKNVRVYSKKNSNPQKVMSFLMNNLITASKLRYGQDLYNSVLIDGKTAVFNKIMAQAFFPDKIVAQMNAKIPKTDTYLKAKLPFGKQGQVNFYQLTMPDVYHAQKRVLHQISLINQRDNYDDNNTLEVERDINQDGSMNFTLNDFTTLGLAIEAYLDTHKVSTDLRKRLNQFSNSVHDSKHPVVVDKMFTSDLLSIMDAEFSQIKPHMANEDLRNWKRLHNKLQAYLKFDKSKNGLLASAKQACQQGKVQKTFDILLTNLHFHDKKDTSTCTDKLGRLTEKTMLDGFNGYQFGILHELLIGTSFSKQKVQQADHQILKKFQNKGYKYAQITYHSNSNKIKTIQPISLENCKQLLSLIYDRM